VIEGKFVAALTAPWGAIDFVSRALMPILGTIRATIGLPHCSAQLVRAKGVLPADGTRRIVLYMHGGAFLTCGANSHGRLTTMISRYAGAPVLVVNYRMIPEHSLGQAVEDCYDGWAVFVKPLVEAGYRVVAFDLPSHNESDPGALAPGRTTAIECAHAIAAMIETHGSAHAVVAHSLGANATALAAAQGAHVGRLVFLAPMGDFPLYLDLFAARHGFGRRIRAGLHRRLEKRIAMPLQETNMTRIGRRANYPPLLLIHDPDDPDSPYAASERLATSWQGARLLTTRGLGRLAHYRILRHRPAIRAGLEFIGHHAADTSATEQPSST
jgi:alpha-beta hydrolase superfamily lysophospholipase